MLADDVIGECFAEDAVVVGPCPGRDFVGAEEPVQTVVGQVGAPFRAEELLCGMFGVGLFEGQLQLLDQWR